MDPIWADENKMSISGGIKSFMKATRNFKHPKLDFFLARLKWKLLSSITFSKTNHKFVKESGNLEISLEEKNKLLIV